MPHLRRNEPPHRAAGRFQPRVQPAHIIQQQLLPAGKQQRGRQTVKIAVKRGNIRIGQRRVAGIGGRAERQLLPREQRVLPLVFHIRPAGTRKVHPGRDGRHAGRQRQAQPLEAQAQRKAEPAPRGFAAEHDVRRIIAAPEQMAIGGLRIVERRGIRMLRGEAVGRIQHRKAGAHRQRAAKPSRILQPAGRIATAVQIQQNPPRGRQFGRRGQLRPAMRQRHRRERRIPPRYELAGLLLQRANGSQIARLRCDRAQQEHLGAQQFGLDVQGLPSLVCCLPVYFVRPKIASTKIPAKPSRNRCNDAR